MPMKTEIVPLLIVTKLEQYDYAGATALALVMLAASFVMLLIINGLQAWIRRHGGEGRGAQVSGAKVIGAQTIALRDSPWLRRTLIAVTLGFLALFVVVPIVAVFVEALSKGIGSYCEADVRTGDAGGDQADVDHRRHRGAAEPRVRRRGGVADLRSTGFRARARCSR